MSKLQKLFIVRTILFGLLGGYLGYLGVGAITNPIKFFVVIGLAGALWFVGINEGSEGY